MVEALPYIRSIFVSDVQNFLNSIKFPLSHSQNNVMLAILNYFSYFKLLKPLYKSFSPYNKFSNSLEN